ncbi:MAG: GFA family protein [Polyangiaceae bacterium]
MSDKEASTYEGGCHCGQVRFRVTTSEHVAYDCNCSVCTMKGLLHLIVPKDAFELLRGEEELSLYTFGTHTARHTFCKHCGVQPFYVPRSHPDGVDVNVHCLDGEAKAAFRVEPFDGRNWERNVEKIR